MQRKATKRNTPRSLRRSRDSRERCPALLANPEREPNSPAAKSTPLGLEHRLANSLGVGCGARLALRGLNCNYNSNYNCRNVGGSLRSLHTASYAMEISLSARVAMDISPTVLPVIGSIVAASIAGMVAFLSTLLSKEQKTSEFRQAWIDELRADISEFIGFVEMFFAYLELKGKKHENEEDSRVARLEFLEAQPEIFYKQFGIYYRIRLRLNAVEHEKLISRLEAAIGLFSGKGKLDSTYVESIVKAIAGESQFVLKKEWSRVKRGEPLFHWTKWVSLAIFVLSLSWLFLFYMSNNLTFGVHQ